MVSFILNLATGIVNTDFPEEPVLQAVKRFRRDMNTALRPLGKLDRGNRTTIRLSRRNLPDDYYRVCVTERDELVVEAGNALGIIYGLSYISRRYLGILPFWFWNDQAIEKRQAVQVTEPLYQPDPFPIKYRGWFVDDEVLLSHWDAGVDSQYPWEMAFETLLRCGGNLVIVGTDRASRRYEQLASDMGLWITHQESEPLGAEQFSRAYPDKDPSFKRYAIVYYKLWEEAVKRQADLNVIWNIGFSGPGGETIWELEPAFDTPKKRGDILGSIMKHQCNLVKQYVDYPVLSTSLHGETLELYRQGYLEIPEDVIIVRSDNGYGKMVSPRMGSYNPRTSSLPDKIVRGREQGIDYHVSCHDFQAGSHITMMPNSTEFMDKEIRRALYQGVDSLLLVHASNIKPHVFPLDFIASLWSGSNKSTKDHMRRYLEEYYPACASPGRNEILRDYMEACFLRYYKSAMSYGPHEEEHAGEQFYNYVTRELACCWIKGSSTPSMNLSWCTREDTLSGQMQWYHSFCESGINRYHILLEKCSEIAAKAGPLWEDSLLLQVRIYYNCIRGAVEFGRSFAEFEAGEYLESFYSMGHAVDAYQEAVDAMNQSCHDKWKGFYENECLTDVKETVYLLRCVMSYIRILGDGPYFNFWQHQITSLPEDQNVTWMTNRENHMTDEALYEAMKAQVAAREASGELA